jgi:hypothetical protein
MRRILYLLFFPVFVFGQTAQETVDRKLKFATEQFQTNNESDFVVATPYIKSYVGIAGSPFWATDVWSSAEVVFKGKTYKVSELKYDCANDLMVLPSYTKEGIELLNLIPSCYPELYINIKQYSNQRGNGASEIVVKREHFIFYAASKEEKIEGVPFGYYHFLQEKRFPLLCKYSSTIVERSNQKAFEEEQKYYLQKEGKLVWLHRVGSFIDAFPQWKDKINSFVEENNISTLVSLDFVVIEKLVAFINKQSTP